MQNELTYLKIWLIEEEFQLILFGRDYGLNGTILQYFISFE